MSAILTVKTRYYQGFDADLSRAVPAEGLGGWKTAELPLSLDHTAVVVMHAWETGTLEQYPGWHRAVEYFPRASEILRQVMPDLLLTVRAAGMKVIHVIVPTPLSHQLDQFRKARELAGAEPSALPQAQPDTVLIELRDFRKKWVFPGEHNAKDIERGFEDLSFPPEAEPREDEAIVATSKQLFAVCQQENVNHLIYTGFAINMCLLFAGGGMVDMSRRGVLCSAIPQAVTAVENHETARGELAKAQALWLLAMGFGFLYDFEDFKAALRGL